MAAVLKRAGGGGGVGWRQCTERELKITTKVGEIIRRGMFVHDSRAVDIFRPAPLFHTWLQMHRPKLVTYSSFC